jgi:hypothetical protein
VAKSSGIVGRRYLERGEPVTVLTQWKHSTGDPAAMAAVLWCGTPAATGPTNVEIERGDGTRVVRPFHGLRRAES